MKRKGEKIFLLCRVTAIFAFGAKPGRMTSLTSLGLRRLPHAPCNGLRVTELSFLQPQQMHHAMASPTPFVSKRTLGGRLAPVKSDFRQCTQVES